MVALPSCHQKASNQLPEAALWGNRCLTFCSGFHIIHVALMIAPTRFESSELVQLSTDTVGKDRPNG